MATHTLYNAAELLASALIVSGVLTGGFVGGRVMDVMTRSSLSNCRQVYVLKCHQVDKPKVLQGGASHHLRCV